MTTPREIRIAEVHRRLVDAEHSFAERYTDSADVIRHRFERLRAGLALAHAHSASVDDVTWADYVTDLDLGLDELDKEIDRAADRPDSGPGVAEVLVVHTSALELTGWRLRVSLHDDPSADLAEVRARLGAATAELDRYEAGRGADDLDRSMDDLRRAAGRARTA